MNNSNLASIEIRKKYTSLLLKFCGDKDLINLLEQCIIDNIRETEDLYKRGGKYPEKRNLLDKLIYDLETTRKTVIERKLGGKNKNE